jgi:hypothetical protein
MTTLFKFFDKTLKSQIKTVYNSFSKISHNVTPKLLMSK